MRMLELEGEKLVRGSNAYLWIFVYGVFRCHGQNIDIFDGLAKVAAVDIENTRLTLNAITYEYLTNCHVYLY